MHHSTIYHFNMAGKNVLKFLTIVMFVWLVILLYMGMNLYQLVEESEKTAVQLEIVEREAEFLRKENIELRQETNIRKIRAIHNADTDTIESNIADVLGNEIRLKALRKNMDDIELDNKLEETQEFNREPSIQYEMSRRRIDSYVLEMQYFVLAKLRSLQLRSKDIYTSNKLDKFRDNIENLSILTINELEQLKDLDGMKEYRVQAHQRLSNLVQRRLHRLQNPKDCKKARRLVCTLNKGCGYGCQIHHVIYCLIVAYASNRTMVMNSVGWRYSRKGWEGTFLPVSDTCRNVGFGTVYWGKPYNTNALIAHLPIIDSLFPRPLQLPQAVPRDLVDKILRFNETPFHWWIGQLCAYLFRYQPSMIEKLKEKKKKIGFEAPIVGLHVRRTDKIDLEAAHHGIDEYMEWTKLYYDRMQLNSNITVRRVYLATDDKNLFAEAVGKYPGYTFVSDNEASKLADLDHRHTEASLHGVITDIHLLSESDYLVCTFSSQVCRLAYEIMSSRHLDASRKFHSLDDIYYFGGQNEHKVRARYAHKATSSNELDLEVGDELSIAGNHWNGFSKGFSHRTHLEGIFPSYKIEDIVDVADFPIH